MSSTQTNPHGDALCIMLARHNAVAGVLLYKIVYWSKYALAKIPKVNGTWVANKRLWWARETQLSVRQIDRAFANLEKWGLIEKRQWWWGRENILYVRPTATVVAFLDMATTWDAADEFLEAALEAVKKAPPGLSNLAHPGSPKGVSSNGVAISGEPGSHLGAISKYIKHQSNSLKSNSPSGADPASPSSAVSLPGEEIEEETSGENIELEYVDDVESVLQLTVLKSGKISIGSLVEIWASAIATNFPKAKPPLISATDIGTLASLVNDAAKLGASTANVIVHMLLYWEHLDEYQKPKIPSARYVREHFAEGHEAWTEAGQPSHVVIKTQDAGGKVS